MSKAYVFDTSALLAYIENEEGVIKIESLLLQALDNDIEITISIISNIELFYITLREQGEKKANERLGLIKDLPIKQEPLNQKMVKIIGKIKANNPMSLADCCIAGLAKAKKATLVHKDPEFEKVAKEVKQIKLPYKLKA